MIFSSHVLARGVSPTFLFILASRCCTTFLYEEYHTLYHTDIKIPFNEIHTSDKIIVSTYCIKGYL